VSHDLSGYEEVPDRIARFIEKYPDGRLTGQHKVIEVGGNILVEYVAHAYRDAEDMKPGRGVTWEPYPGRTPYTKDSEVENAETSAWGRALAAIGFTGKKIATAEEVSNAQSRRGEESVLPRKANSRSGGKPSDAQLSFLKKLLVEKKPSLDQLTVILGKIGADGVDPNVTGWSQQLTAGKEGTASLLITFLKENPLPDVENPSDLSSDFDPGPSEPSSDEEVPFDA
jgi:hypothetical protein